MYKKDISDTWRGGVYLCTAEDNLEADLLESKLRSEEIVCIRRYEGGGNYVESVMGINSARGIDLYVAEEHLEDAANIIVPIDLDDCEEFH